MKNMIPTNSGLTADKVEFFRRQVRKIASFYATKTQLDYTKKTTKFNFLTTIEKSRKFYPSKFSTLTVLEFVNGFLQNRISAPAQCWGAGPEAESRIYSQPCLRLLTGLQT